MKYKAVIFDFDGTICDTGEGILKSAKYALDYYNIEAPEYTELTFFIGPPLLVTFQEKFGVDANMADKLVKKYRERYTNKGLLESELYDGIKELLSKLKKENIKLGIASSKPQDYVEALLDHYGVKSYFDVICGVTFSADCESKANIISRCIKELDTQGNETLMVGDKKYDIDDIILSEYGTTVVGLEMLRSVKEEDAEIVRNQQIVKSAINTLSFSEIEAITHVFDELDNKEGVLVASKIADRVGITRSVIVNALRKFESAGVIESHSSGMKGTYIKVLNDEVFTELAKIRKS